MLSNNDYIRNPKTNRPVKVGSRVWRDLVKEGMVSSQNYQDEKELYALKPNDDPSQVIQQLNKTLPRSKQAVRGRGMYQGKIVKKEKPYNNLEDTVNMVKKASCKAMKNMPPPESSDDEDWTNQLENLIMMEIVQPSNPQRKKVGINPKSKALSQSKQEEDYEEIQPQEEDSDEDDENLENENDY
jgi:hypothetical protein